MCFVPHLLPDPPRPDRDVLRPRGRCRRGARAARGRVRRLADGRRPARGRDARALAGAGHRRGRDRRLRRPRDRHDRSSSARSTTSARAQPARPSRTRTSRSAFPRPPACASRESRLVALSVTAPQGFVASRRPRGHPTLGEGSRRLPLRPRPPSGAAMFSRNKVQAACLLVNRDHLEQAEPQAVVVNSGVANSATGERGQARRARHGGRGRPAARPADRAGPRPLDRRDRRPAAARPAARRAAALPFRTLSAEGGARRGRGDHDDRHDARRRPRSRGTASRSAAWRRAPG